MFADGAAIMVVDLLTSLIFFETLLADYGHVLGCKINIDKSTFLHFNIHNRIRVNNIELITGFISAKKKKPTCKIPWYQCFT